MSLNTLFFFKFHLNSQYKWHEIEFTTEQLMCKRYMVQQLRMEQSKQQHKDKLHMVMCFLFQFKTNEIEK